MKSWIFSKEVMLLKEEVLFWNDSSEYWKSQYISACNSSDKWKRNFDDLAEQFIEAKSRVIALEDAIENEGLEKRIKIL